MNRRINSLSVSMLALAIAGCSPASPSTPTGSGGSGNPGSGGSATGTGGAGSGGSGGATGTGGASGTGGTTGSGGTGGAVGGSGGGSGGAAGGTDGGSGGSDGGPGGATMAKPCPTTPGMQTANLTIRRPEIGARRVAAVPAGEIVRIAHNPMTNEIIIMHGGSFSKLDPVANTVTSYNGGSPGGTVRGFAIGPDGTFYALSVGGNLSVTVRKGVAAGASRTWTTMATSDGYPGSNTNFIHSWAGLAVSPDNMWVYFSSGSRTDHGETGNGGGEVPLTSAIFRIPVNATGVMLRNDEAMLKTAGLLYADGIRNAFDLGFNSEGELFAPDNGPDMDLPDEVNWVQEGKHYGFPWRFGDVNLPTLDATYNPAGDTRLHTGYMAVSTNTYVYSAGFPMPPAGVVFTDPILNRGPDADKFRPTRTSGPTDASMTNMPFAGITPHRSPLGIAFDTKGVLCGDYYKSAFMLSYGTIPPGDLFSDKGEDLLLLQMTKVGDKYEMKATQLAVGIRTPMDSVLVDNKLYTVGPGDGNSIFEFTFPKPAP